MNLPHRGCHYPRAVRRAAHVNVYDPRAGFRLGRCFPRDEAHIAARIRGR